MTYTVQRRSYSKETVNQLYNYSTVLGAAIKCKPYTEITVEIRTHLKTVKITLNIFAVYGSFGQSNTACPREVVTRDNFSGTG